jgi:hypothetical protein
MTVHYFCPVGILLYALGILDGSILVLWQRRSLLHEAAVQAKYGFLFKQKKLNKCGYMASGRDRNCRISKRFRATGKCSVRLRWSDLYPCI